VRRFVLDARGEPQLEPDFIVWARWFETSERTLAYDEIRPGVRVSTIFLGIDASEHDPPMLWETLVRGGFRDEETRRYASHADAVAGHTKICESLKRLYEGVS
jgi:hypothetical protein